MCKHLTEARHQIHRINSLVKSLYLMLKHQKKFKEVYQTQNRQVEIPRQKCSLKDVDCSRFDMPIRHEGHCLNRFDAFAFDNETGESIARRSRGVCLIIGESQCLRRHGNHAMVPVGLPSQ